MKKRILISSIFVAAFLLLAWGMGGRTGFDYGLTCTKCLDDSHVIERKFLGVTYSNKTTRWGAPSDYADITGHECKHVFHKGGCGKSWISWSGSGIGCGMTGEGMVFRDRNQAIRRTFELHQRFGNKALAKRTLDLIDKWLPPDFDWKASRGRSELRDRMLCFSLVFHETESEVAWQRLLDVAEHGTLIELSNQITQQAGTSNGG
jgi:hypothetical protein